MALTAAYQFQFNGLVLGDGTPYDLIVVRGLDDLPEIRTSDTERPADHGLFPGRDLAAGRIIELELEVTGTSADNFRDNVDALALATIIADDEQALSFRLPSLDDRRVLCRARRRALPVDLGYALTFGAAILQFVATDPRVYADTETVLNTAAATSGGGRTYDRTYNLTYAAGGAGGSILATNQGHFPSRPVLDITGPSTSPRVENITAGRHLEFGLVLAAGEFLRVDTDARTVMLNGTASRYSTLTPGSSWWELPSGDNSLLFTTADSLGTLEVRYRSAWL